MSDEANTLELAPGYQTAFRIRAVPKTEFALQEPAAQTLDQAVQTITLSATCKNLPDGIDCDLYWLIDSDQGSRVVQDECRLQVSGETATIELEVDVMERQLFGRGALGFEVRPRFPYAPVSTLAAGALRFDNRCEIATSYSSPCQIGSKVEFTLERSGLFAGGWVGIAISETDTGEEAAGGYKDHGVVWKPGSAAMQAWRVGCTQTSGDVRFNYREFGEQGEMEFAYGVYWSPAPASGAKPTWQEIERVDPFLTGVIFPFLTRLDLDRTSWGGLELKGEVRGFAPGLKVPFKTKLDCVSLTESLFGDGIIEHDFVLEDDGTFSFTAAKAPWSSFSSNVAVELTCTAIAAHEPFGAVIRFDPRSVRPSGGTAAKAGKAAKAASKKTPAGDVGKSEKDESWKREVKGAKDCRVRSSQIYVDGQHFVDWWAATHKGWPNDAGLGNALSKDGFTSMFDAQSAFSGKDEISFYEFLAHFMIMYNELGGRFVPKPENGHAAYFWEYRYRCKNKSCKRGKESGASRLDQDKLRYCCDTPRPGRPKNCPDCGKACQNYKSSYNGLYSRLAGDQLDALIKAEEMPSGFTSWSDIPGSKEAWNSRKTCFPDPDGKLPAEVVHELDFYKFRGRGLNQLTWRSNYEKYANPLLTKYYGKTVDQLSNAELDMIFGTDARIYGGAYGLYYAGKRKKAGGDPLTDVEAGKFFAWGRATGSDDAYGKKFEKRCKTVVDALAGKTITTYASTATTAPAAPSPVRVSLHATPGLVVRLADEPLPLPEGDLLVDEGAGGGPPWLDHAWGELGVKEDTDDDRDNEEVTKYHETTTITTASTYEGDETAWCSSFVNWCFTRAGKTGTNSAASQSWRDWGKQIDKPALGAVLVMKTSKGGHATFVVGKKGDAIQGLGGNQSDCVKVSNYTEGATYTDFEYRVPSDYTVPEGDYELSETTGEDAGGVQSTR